VIAIDGPAASGKSSVARRLAARLGCDYINSGSIYRAMTWELLRCGVSPNDPAAIAAAVGRTEVECRLSGTGESCVFVGGQIVGNQLRDEIVNKNVSTVSAVPAVRDFVSGYLRRLVGGRTAVVEGRDIGSAVFPDTRHKFYLDASPEIRRKRRAAEGQEDEIEARDRMDSSRAAAPLVRAVDAQVIDTSALSLDGVVEEIFSRLASEGIGPRPA
jgi:cytidylate kinase